MRIRWRNFELPGKVEVDRETLSPTYGRFAIEPFERGYGTTVGNSIRRVLLSSLEGTAVTSIKIQDVQHEFSTISGVLEDVTDIILNIKKLLLKIEVNHPVSLRIEETEPGEVTAGHIQPHANLEVVNPQMHIATIVEPTRFVVDLEARRGRGYVTAAENEREGQDLGTIPVDSIFSPVLRVKHRTEDTRVGQMVNYDRLILEIWTDGTVEPEMALVEAAKILRKHLNPFVHYFDLGPELQQASKREDEEEKRARHLEEFHTKLARPISELDLSVRATNCLEAEGLKTMADLVKKPESQMLEIRNLGKTSLKEIKKKLTEAGLSLGMDLNAPEKLQEEEQQEQEKEKQEEEVIA
jgi:DNA-directed RNA polymerase subunit alpha